MKMYRLDCESSYRLVFQIKNLKLFTRLREWYKFKIMVNRLTKREFSNISYLVRQEIIRTEETIVKEKSDFNSMRHIHLSVLKEIYNKIL